MLPPVTDRSYTFRNKGATSVNGSSRPVPERTERLVREVEASSDGSGASWFKWLVEAASGDDTVATRYELRPAAIPSRGDDRAGLFLTQVVERTPEGTTAFTPQPSILLLPFPAQAGTRWRSSGVDPLSQTAMTIEARVGVAHEDGSFQPFARVDACGTVLQGWNVEVLSADVVGPGRRLNHTGRYVVGTQYGSLILEELVKLTGQEFTDTTAMDVHSIISAVPAVPE